MRLCAGIRYVFLVCAATGPMAVPAAQAQSDRVDTAPPVPVPRPGIAYGVPPPTPRPAPEGGKEPAAKTEMVKSERECRMRLEALGVRFVEKPPILTTVGCRIDRPVLVTLLGEGILLQPEAVLNCSMAETIARFANEVVRRLALAGFGQNLRGIKHSSAYVCRSRNGSAKLSEHAYGNALDISSFMLADKTKIEIRLREGDTEPAAVFQKAVRAAACGPFKTVLGPGTDADHAHHMHLDLAQRRNGSTYCR